MISYKYTVIFGMYIIQLILEPTFKYCEAIDVCNFYQNLQKLISVLSNSSYVLAKRKLDTFHPSNIIEFHNQTPR